MKYVIKSQKSEVPFLDQLIERLNDAALPAFNKSEIIKELNAKGVEVVTVKKVKKPILQWSLEYRSGDQWLSVTSQKFATKADANSHAKNSNSCQRNGYRVTKVK